MKGGGVISAVIGPPPSSATQRTRWLERSRRPWVLAHTSPIEAPTTVAWSMSRFSNTSRSTAATVSV